MDELQNKEELEKRKLELEIKKLNLPWYRNLELWKTVIPTLAILLSLYFTFGRGLIDAEKEKLQIQKEQLKLEILQFEKLKSEVKIDIRDLERELHKKDSLIERRNDTLNILMKEITNFTEQIRNAKSKLRDVSSSHKKDRDYYQRELKQQYKLEKKHGEEVRGLLEKNSALNKTILGLEAEKKFYASKLKLSEIDSLALIEIRLSAERKYWDQELKKLEGLQDRIKERFEKNRKEIENMSDDELIRFMEKQWLKHEADTEEH